MKRRLLKHTVILALLIVGLANRAADWPQWRGPSTQGICTESNLPLTWGGKDNANVAWKVELPKSDTSQSSPIVWKDNIFVTTAVNKPLEQRVTCFNKTDGSQKWSVVVPPGPWLLTDLRGGYSCASPCTDGERVYTLFGSAVLSALDFSGKEVWRNELNPHTFDVAISSSPILYKDTVILLCDQNVKNSFLAAYDCKDGKVRWEVKRPDAGFNHSTPLLTEIDGKTQLLVAASNALQGIDPDNGKLLWWAKGKGDIATPVYANQLAYVDDARGGTGICVDVKGSGDISATNVKWSKKTMVDGFNSPLIVDGRLYRFFNQLKCFELATGNEIYAQALPDKGPRASPFTTPDGRIYYASAGTSYVIQSGAEYKLLAKNDLGDNSAASAAISDGRIILKGSKNLFCIMEKK